MDLRAQYQLNPRKIIKKTIEFSLIWVIMVIAFPILVFHTVAVLLLTMGMVLFIILIVHWWADKYYAVYYYSFDDNGLEIRKGVFFQHSVTIPMEKISDFYVDQDLLDRFFGLYDLHFSSASLNSGVLAHIDGMDETTTNSLCAFLLKSAGVSKGESDEPSTISSTAGAPAQKKTIAAFRPDPNGYWLQFGVIAVCFFVASPWALLDFKDLPIFSLFLLCCGFALAALAFIDKKSYDSIEYELRTDGVWICRAWPMRSETLLLYGNIQDTGVYEPFIMRIIGLGAVSIKTMSYRPIALSFLKMDDARKIQQLISDHIKYKAAVQHGRAAELAAKVAASTKPSGPVQTNPYENHFLLAQVPPFPIFLALVFVAFTTVFVIYPQLGSSGFALFLMALFFGAVLAGYALITLGIALADIMSYSYWFEDDNFVIKIGILEIGKKMIRYEKIQDIKVQCSFLNSFIGLCDVCISTGSKELGGDGGYYSTSGIASMTTCIVPCLKIKDAMMLRDRLLKIACISCPKNQTPLRATMPLSARKPLKKTVSRIGILSVQLLIICAVLGMLLPFDRLRTLLILIALPGLYILCSALTYPYEKRYQEKYFYDADDESLIIHKGVFGWREIVVPFRNIQSVYVDQDIYDVYFNLWDVWITTATFTSGPMAHIDGLEISDAEKLARLIIDRVEKSRSGD